MAELTTVDTKAAAARIGLAAGTLRNMRIRREGPAHAKIGRAVRYRVSDLDAWLAARIVHFEGAPE
jgi:predicted DNA-binding transcriptional regulator AlpA